MTRTVTLICTFIFSLSLYGVFVCYTNSIPLIVNELRTLTGYFFGVNVDSPFLISLSAFPFTAALCLPKDKAVYKISDVCIVILAMFIWVFVFFILSLLVLSFFGRSSNPLMPDKILTETFPFYMALFIIIGLVSGGFLISKFFKHKYNKSAIDDIGSSSL